MRSEATPSLKARPAGDAKSAVRRRGFAAALTLFPFPGEGRAQHRAAPNWAPVFAGEARWVRAARMITELAPAKINLALHVRAKRPDGYHEIETLFAFCRDGDVVTVAEVGHDSFTITGP